MRRGYLPALLGTLLCPQAVVAQGVALQDGFEDGSPLIPFTASSPGVTVTGGAARSGLFGLSVSHADPGVVASAWVQYAPGGGSITTTGFAQLNVWLRIDASSGFEVDLMNLYDSGRLLGGVRLQAPRTLLLVTFGTVEVVDAGIGTNWHHVSLSVMNIGTGAGMAELGVDGQVVHRISGLNFNGRSFDWLEVGAVGNGSGWTGQLSYDDLFVYSQPVAFDAGAPVAVDAGPTLDAGPPPDGGFVAPSADAGFPTTGSPGGAGGASTQAPVPTVGQPIGCAAGAGGLLGVGIALRLVNRARRSRRWCQDDRAFSPRR